MSDVAAVLKREIVRLARKELRSETEQLRKTSAHYRSEIAALKRRVAVLEKQSARNGKNGGKAPEAAEAPKQFRFSGKGLLALRQRLGLSAADLGALLEVSTQTVYNWESNTTRPREQHLAAISALRRVGKRELAARLAASDGEAG